MSPWRFSVRIAVLSIPALLLLPSAVDARGECLAVTERGKVLAVETTPDGQPNLAPVTANGLAVRHYWCWSAEQPPQRLDPALEDAASQRGDLRNEEIEAARIRIDLEPARKCSSLTLIAAPMAMWQEVPESMLPQSTVPDSCRPTILRRAGEPLRLRVTGGGLGTWWQDFAPQETSTTLRPRPAATIGVQVAGPDGQPVTDAGLSVLTARRTGRPSMLAQFSARGGVIEIPDLPESAPVVAVFAAPGHVDRNLETMLHALPRRISLQLSATVHGRLLDSGLQPLTGVTVQAEAWLDDKARLLLHRSAATDPDGRWVLEGLPMGKIVVQARAEGFASWHAPFQVESRDLDVGTVLLQPGTRLVVVVADPQGTPVSNASVRAGVQAHAHTDQRGRAELEGLARSARARLTLDAPGFLETETVVELGGNDAQQVTLYPAFEIAGRFVDASGEPLDGGRAEIVDGSFSRYAQLDSDGSFLLELEPERPVELRLSAPRSAPVALPVAPGLAGELRDLGDVRAPGSRTAIGRVLCADTEAPVPDAQIWSARPSARNPLHAWLQGDLLRTATDAEGWFLVEGLEAAPATLTIEAPGFARAQIRVPVAQDGEQLDLGDVILARGAEIEALVEDDVSERAVARLDLAGRWSEMDMLTSPVVDGEARFRHVPASEATLTVLDGYRLVCEETIEIPDEPLPVQVRCRSRAMTVSGTVQVADRHVGPGLLTWLPAQTDVQATIMNSHSPLGLNQSYVVGAGRPQVDVAVGADGFFTTDALRAGDWEVLWLPESGGASQLLSIRLAQQPQLEIEVDFPGRVLEGRVVDLDGDPVPGARVRELGFGTTAWSGEDGWFQLVGLIDGEYFLRADDRGTESETVPVLLAPQSTPDTVQLVLGAETEQEAIHIVVVDGEERPQSGAFVFLDTGPQGLRVIMTNAEGRAEARLDPPYPTQVRWAAWANGAWFLGQPLLYGEAVDHPQVITFSEGGTLELRSESHLEQARLVSATAWDVTSLMQRLGLPTAAGRDAPLVVGGLPPGNYQVQLEDRLAQTQIRRNRLEVVKFD